ncbi:MAG TPA: hypothetical protein VGY98_07715 [Verrucomicrobiae bacterium]|nr:hypothetical protein [Verrucomicrobiae bacterium]
MQGSSALPGEPRPHASKVRATPLDAELAREYNDLVDQEIDVTEDEAKAMAWQSVQDRYRQAPMDPNQPDQLPSK